MKKIFISLFFLTQGFVFAAQKPKTGGGAYYPPEPNTFNSNSVHISSSITHTAFSTATAEVAVSTRSALMHTINVTVAGASGADLLVYNGSVSTASATLLFRIDTTAKVAYPFDIGFSSGILWWNRGTTPAEATMTYMER